MNETWLPVVGYEGIYEVSSMGRLKRVARGQRTRPGYIHTPATDRVGYFLVGLTRDGATKQRRLARVVAEAFFGARPRPMQVNHKNGIKSDNRVINLEWMTPLENIRHAVSTGLAHPAKGAAHWHTSLTASDVLSIRARAANDESHTSIAKDVGVSRPSITVIVHRKTWAHI